MRILLIDDDINMCKGMAQQFTKFEIIYDIAHTGEEGLELVKSNVYDLIILDIMLPDALGYNILKRIRMNQIDYPVLILTDRSQVQERLKGFEYGADDYLTKPFNQEELFARIHAIIRRSKGHSGSMIQVGDLMLNLNERSAQINGKIIDLTNTEYKILELLMLHKGSTLHKEIFFEHIYSSGIDVPEVKIIDVFVCKIRKKISDACGYDPGYIQTIWGRGYVLNDVDAINRAGDIDKISMMGA